MPLRSILLQSTLLGRHRLVLEKLALCQQLATGIHGTPVLGGLHHVYRAVA
jgi:hypothetical protein